MTIRWSDTKQTIDGFGASSAFFGETITNEVADQLFDAKKGIGLSLLRTMIGLPDDVLDGQLGAHGRGDANRQHAGADHGAAGHPARNQGLGDGLDASANLEDDQQQERLRRRLQSNKLDPAHYQDYANYLADFVDLMAKNNMPIMGLSPANEPDYTASWDGAQWTPTELTTFISQNLGPTFAQRFPSVKIIAPDTASWPNVDKYLTPMLADPAAKDYLSVVATHPYQNGSAAIQLDYKKPAQNGKQFWQSEWSQENPKGDTPNPTMTSAIDMMKRLHDHMVISNMNAWNWWAIYISADALASADMPKIRREPRPHPAGREPSASPTCSSAATRWGTGPSSCARGFSASPRPTSRRAVVLIEAYRDATHIAVIAVNTGSKPVTQKFILDGATFGTLTPWVTSPDDNLAAKDPFTAYDTFTYDLPASSVVTFVNWDATTETPGQGTLPGDVDGGTDIRISTGLDCPNALVPNNGVNGGVTDFSDWKGGSGQMGRSAGAVGEHLRVQGPERLDDERRGGEPGVARHGRGHGERLRGAGLSFQVCTTVASFTHVQFTLSGSSPGCDMELQIKTFDQQPKQQTPPGGCDQNFESCYNFPVKKQVAVPTAQPTVITTPLAEFTKWSAANAGQVVGLQWQFTGTNVGPTPAPAARSTSASPASGSSTSTPETPAPPTPLTPGPPTRLTPAIKGTIAAATRNRAFRRPPRRCGR